jgi:hypothetical protein
MIEINILKQLIQKYYFSVNGRLDSSKLIKLEKDPLWGLESQSIVYYTDFLPDTTRFGERIYCILNDINKPLLCVCGEKLDLIRFSMGYLDYHRRCRTAYNKLHGDIREKRGPYKKTQSESVAPIEIKSTKLLVSLLEPSIFTKAGNISTQKLNLKNNLLNAVLKFTSYLDYKDPSLLERLYCLFNNVTTVPLCQHCSKEARFSGYKKGYRLFCSKDCYFKSDFFKNLTVKARSSITPESHKQANRRKKLRKHKTWNKGLRYTYEELYGVEKANILKLNLKQRMLVLKQQTGSSVLSPPMYNLNACNVFKKLNRDLDLNGQHGTEKGEYQLLTEDLNYWLDYIDIDNKLIIEWDEEYHFGCRRQIEKDLIREARIKDHFYDYMFIRIREKEFNEKYYQNLCDTINEYISYLSPLSITI